MDLSVLIPSRNEMFLKNTVEDVLAHAKAETEVIVILDGAWPETPLDQHERVTVVYHPESVGQRAATNEAARIASGRYVMKLDAHCSLADGFDVALIEAARELGEDVTQIPTQKNLHAFDWVCQSCQARRYQGPTPAECSCSNARWERELVWKPRRGVTTYTWRFDRDLHFQYWGEYSKRPGFDGTDFPETMSCLGACWFLSRDRYWQIGGMDEGHGSWGQMGTELGCKSWLSGGRMVTNKRTWFAHMFRTQGGDFSFPYELKGVDQDKARRYSRDLWNNNRWSGQVRPLSWLIEHFAPVPGWEEVVHSGGRRNEPSTFPPATSPAPSVTGAGPSKGVLYYSDCRGDETILRACRDQLRRAAKGLKIVGVTLAPLKDHFPDGNIVYSRERGYLTMFEQILFGLEALDTDLVYFAEHDVLYHQSHFAHTPPERDLCTYNVNVWKVDAASGRALHYITRQTSGLVADRKLLLDHYRRRVELVRANGFSRRMGFEPGTHRRPERVDDLQSAEWRSELPNVDIRHGKNLTASRWKQEEFRDKRNCREWTEADEVPGWGVTKGRFTEFLADVEKGVS